MPFSSTLNTEKRNKDVCMDAFYKSAFSYIPKFLIHKARSFHIKNLTLRPLLWIIQNCFCAVQKSNFLCIWNSTFLNTHLLRILFNELLLNFYWSHFQGLCKRSIKAFFKTYFLRIFYNAFFRQFFTRIF